MQMKIQLEELIKSPLALLTIKDKEIIAEIDQMLPYSIGMEINACYKTSPEGYNISNFLAIPDIMYAGGSSGEQRYRIPNGFVGLVCLYNLSIQLKYNCDLNPQAGIHYHVDCQTDDSYSKIIDSYHIIKERHDWILSELDTWEYPGTYNRRGICLAGMGTGNWLRGNGEFSTLEFRIGEMTFDYELLLKRIRHITEIVRTLKEEIGTDSPVFQSLDIKKQISYQRTLALTGRLSMGMQGILNNLYNSIKSMEKEEEEARQAKEEAERQRQAETKPRKRLHKINKEEL